MRYFIIFLFTALFGCDTSSNTTAYNEYTQAKQIYIQAVLDNSKSKKIYALKEIVKCGEFLGFNVIEYKRELLKLKPKNPPKIIKSPLKIESNYIKILSFNPLDIKLSSRMKVKYFTLYKYHKHYKIFDIYNAKVNRFRMKKIDNLTIKIAQNDDKRVRIVISSKNKFKIKYSSKNNYLKVNFIGLKKIESLKLPIFKKYNPKTKIIVIDPGHGGKDPGGIGYHHIKEKNIVLPIGLYLKQDLQKKGYKVYITRDRDVFITLRNRTKFANRKKADLFISIHCNIAPSHPEVYGINTYFLSPARSARAKRVARLENSAIGNLRSTTQNIVLNFLNRDKIIASDKLAIDIQKSLIYNFKRYYKHINDGGVHPAPFWVLVGTNMPAILIETGFISNKMEALRLINKTYQKRYAQFIANGIDDYFRKNP